MSNAQVNKMDQMQATFETLRAAASDEVIAAEIFDHALSLIRRHHSGIFWGDRMLTIDKSAALVYAQW